MKVCCEVRLHGFQVTLQGHVCTMVMYLPGRGTDEKLVVRLNRMVSR